MRSEPTVPWKIAWLYNGRFGAVASINASKNWGAHTVRLRSPWQQRCGIIIIVSSPNWGSVRPLIWAGHTTGDKLVGMLISHQYLIFSWILTIRCPVCDIVWAEECSAVVCSLLRSRRLFVRLQIHSFETGANSKIRWCLAKKYVNLNQWLSRPTTLTAVGGAVLYSWALESTEVYLPFYVVLLGQINTRRPELIFDCVFASCAEVRNVWYFDFLSVSMHGINVICQVAQQ
jgi:hypothetical protein